MPDSHKQRTPLAGLSANAISNKPLGPSSVKSKAVNHDTLERADNLHNPNKRSIDQVDLEAEADEDDEEENNSDNDLEGAIIDKSPNQVRGMIRRFIDSGAMKVGEFTDAIGVTGNSYRTFLGQTGNDKGVGSNTYQNAWAFFKKRELKGEKLPAKKRKVAASSSSNKASASALPQRRKTTAVAAHVDISGIELDGEADDTVRIFDSCDEVRRKINAHLRKDGVTQAGFARELHAQFHGPKAPASIQSAQLTRFRGMKGPISGNTNCVYYAAYVFFEKLRVKEGKAKTKHREEMERVWPTGVDTDRRMDRVWCSNDERPFIDQYGGVSFQ